MAQQTRTISVFKTAVGKVEKFQSDAKVFSELKSIISINLDKEKYVIKETLTTLEQDMAVLPEGDFLLFISAKKTKSGATDYDKMSYNDLRKLASERLEKAPSKKVDIIKALVADDKKSKTPTPSSKAKAVKETKGKVATKVLEKAEVEGSLGDILKAHSKVLFELATGMNIVLQEAESTYQIDTSLYTGAIDALPVEKKAVDMLTPEQLKAKEEQEENDRLAREASFIGM